MSLMRCCNVKPVTDAPLRPAAGTLSALKELLSPSSEAAVAGLIQSEVEARGGFLPLMRRFPVDEVFTRGYCIPWGTRDHTLHGAVSSGRLSLGQGGGSGSSMESS